MVRTAGVRQDNRKTKKISWSIKESVLLTSQSVHPGRRGGRSSPINIYLKACIMEMDGDGWCGNLFLPAFRLSVCVCLVLCLPRSFPAYILSECVRVSCSVSSNHHFWTTNKDFYVDLLVASERVQLLSKLRFIVLWSTRVFLVFSYSRGDFRFSV